MNKNVKFDYIKYPIDKRNEKSKNVIEKLNGKIVNVRMNKNENDVEFEECEYRIMSNHTEIESPRRPGSAI